LREIAQFRAAPGWHDSSNDSRVEVVMGGKRHKTERLAVRSRRTVSGTGEAVTAMSVHCPRLDETVPLAECAACDRAETISVQLGHESFVECRPGADGHELWARLARRILPTASDRTPIAAIMTPQVTCVTPDLSLESVTALMLERGFSGVPVVDGEGRPIGIVSKTDLLAYEQDRGDLGVAEPLPIHDANGVELESRDGFHVEPDPRGTVRDVMTPLTYTLRDSDPVSRAAALMTLERVHRLPVVSQDGRVVGIVSTFDFARWLAHEAGYSETGEKR
jgi:CBS domain-containing protein